ncbi:MAG: hypothetical protein E7445_02385 [Ruminococcaceae bacterium]|nr:hypothetical protein [Oscillospiraceae bacterium]
MPIFTTQLGSVERSEPSDALRRMAAHIRYLQEQLEYTLMNLDSSNITEIETDKTDIRSSDGGASFTGNSIALTGSGGESFTAGTADGVFRFALRGKDGAQMLYLTSDGQLVITGNAAVSVDGGQW